MKKLDPGQAITILANVGVIASVVLMAVMLRENNGSLKEGGNLECGV